MWIGGSWDIPYFEGQEPDFEWSEFQVPTPEGGTKAVTFHLDAGMGINAATEHPDEAATVIEWLASDEAAGIMAAELPGFFPVQEEPPAIDDPHAANFLSWNADSETRRALQLAGAQRRLARRLHVDPGRHGGRRQRDDDAGGGCGGPARRASPSGTSPSKGARPDAQLHHATGEEGEPLVAVPRSPRSCSTSGSWRSRC